MGPCAGRDPCFRVANGFRPSAGQQTARDTLHRLHLRPAPRRVFEHKARAVPGFTAKYRIDRLVWYEAHEALEGALIRERQIKKWKRDWKINLIERDNPDWLDLFPPLVP
jgi:putative endonuclease